MSLKLSLLVPYRQREAHLQTQLAWWQQQAQTGLFDICEVLLIEVDTAPSSTVQTLLANTPVQYLHCHCPGPFHKTKALNLGLSVAQGEWIVPLDVDLIPVDDTLQHHLRLAIEAPSLLITGYRVMCSESTIELDRLPMVLETCTIAPEDMPTALWKHLVQHEKFGVVPFFQRQRLQELGGWDEQFVGWGGEDQDLIERYLQTGCTLCRCPELLYLHLFHDREPQWTETALTEQNRRHYYRKAQERMEDSNHGTT